MKELPPSKASLLIKPQTKLRLCFQSDLLLFGFGNKTTKHESCLQFDLTFDNFAVKHTKNQLQ